MAQPSTHEQYLLELINAERAKVGAQPLAFDGDLNEATEGHSQWIIGTDTFSHTGSGGSSAGQRMTAAGYAFTGSWAWGENIAYATTRSPAGLQDEGAAAAHKPDEFVRPSGQHPQRQLSRSRTWLRGRRVRRPRERIRHRRFRAFWLGRVPHRRGVRRQGWRPLLRCGRGARRSDADRRQQHRRNLHHDHIRLRRLRSRAAAGDLHGHVLGRRHRYDQHADDGRQQERQARPDRSRHRRRLRRPRLPNRRLPRRA